MDVDESISHLMNCCYSFFCDLDVSKISNMSDLIIWTSVFNSSWVVVGTSGSTSVCKVSEFMDMESMLSLSKTGKLCSDLNWLANCLSELDNAIDSISFYLNYGVVSLSFNHSILLIIDLKNQYLFRTRK